MFILSEQLIKINGKDYPIIRYDVWFRTPFGLHQNLKEAINYCAARDLDPELMIIAVPVAVSYDNIYEVLLR